MLIEVHAPNYAFVSTFKEFYILKNEVIVTKGRYTLLTESIMMQSEVLQLQTNNDTICMFIGMAGTM